MDWTTHIFDALLAVIGFLAVYILNSIKDEIKDLSDSVDDLNKDLREGVTGLDRRVTVCESRLSDCEYHRRTDNGR